MAWLPIYGELRSASNSIYWEPMFILYCNRSIGGDYRLAMDINRAAMDVYNVVNQRALFIGELDSLGVRPVPAKMAEFLKEIQMKDRETCAKLQIMEREMKLNASQKELFIQKLKGPGCCSGSYGFAVLAKVKRTYDDQSFAGLMRDLCFELKITMHKNKRLIAELEALGELGDAVTSLNHIREIVARESAKLVVLEQLLAGTDVAIRMKDGYVADME
ncbi:hypothetical protein Tco_1205432 [Tanacetum coccineum]